MTSTSIQSAMQFLLIGAKLQISHKCACKVNLIKKRCQVSAIMTTDDAPCRRISAATDMNDAPC